MKKYMQLGCVVLLLVGTTLGHAQSGKVKQAAQRIDRLAYADAIEIYENLVNQGYINSSILQNLGDAYYFNGKLSEANQWYRELFEGTYDDKNSATLASEYYYRYAQTLKSEKNYTKSQEFMDQFYALEQEDTRAILHNKNRDYLATIERKSDRYEISALPFNSEYSDYGGTMVGNAFVFTSARATANEKGNAIHSWTNESYTSLYESQVNKEGFGDPVRLAITDSEVNEATAVFTKDGKTMYFTRNNATNKGKSKQNKDKTSFLKIYKAVKQSDGQWGQVEELPINSDDFNTAHPALTPDEKWLYFASDRKGGVGQSDLYRISLYDNGEYGGVEALKNINTEGRESFPFISSDQQLYFSSDGHPGLGGLDVFSTRIMPDGSFGPVVNMGEPINSNKDDFGIYLDAKENKGFVSSNREGGKGADDIYFWAEKPCKQTLEGIVYDKKTKLPLANAKVVVSDAVYQKSETFYTDSKGYYSVPQATDCEVKYRIRVEVADYNPTEITTLNVENKPGVRKVDIELELKEVSIKVNDNLAETLNLKPIHFDFDKSDIRYDASIELMKIVEVMRKYPSLKVDVRSHTDSKGKDSYNLSLSERRAKSTVAWMIQQGIDAKRLSGRGYGETKLLNNCSNGKRCSDDEHAQNRRSEFIVVEN